jgi:hypothetical protein
MAMAVVALLAEGCVARWSRPDLADGAGRTGDALVQHAARVCRDRRPAGEKPTYDFTSDGCSMWPDSTWVSCCVEHDVDYWCGGNARARGASDAGLGACVRARAGRHVGDLMYWGVRAGGIPWQPFPWRWAYGFRGVRGYEGN